MTSGMPRTVELCHLHHSTKPFQVLKILRVQDPATLTFRHLNLHGTGKLIGAEMSGVGTSAKDGGNHSASLSKFLLLSKRNEKSSRLGQKFKDRLAESKYPLSAFHDTCYTWGNCCYSDLIAFSYLGTSSGTRQQKTGSMTGRKTYWQKCLGIGLHLSVAPTAPASSTLFRFKPQRISHFISAPSHGHNAKPFPYRGPFVSERDNRALELPIRSLNQRLENHPRLLATLE